MMSSVRAALTPIRLALVLIGLLLCQAGLLTAGDPSPRAQRRQLLKTAHAEIAVGQPEAALISLQALLDIDPRNSDAHYLMGKIKFSQNAVAEAEEILRRGMTLAPLSSRIKLLLARIALARNAPDEAEDLIAEVLALKPRDAQANYLLGSVALANGDTTRTLDLWQKILATELGSEAP